MAQGTVEKIHNNGRAYNVVIDGTWYGYGFLNQGEPDFKEGDSISFEYDDNGKYKQLKKDTIKTVSNKKSSGGGSSSGADARQLSIQYQSSRNAAIETVGMMVSGGYLPVPTKKADQYDAVLALIDELTIKYHVEVDLVVENGGLVLEDDSAFADPDSFEE